MNDTALLAVSLAGVAGAALLAQSTAPTPRLLGGKVGRYESGGRKFVSFSQASRHNAHTIARIQRIDEAITQLRKERAELEAATGIRDQRKGVGYATT